MFHKVYWTFTLIWLLVIAACTPAGTVPGAAPEDEAAEQVGAEAIAAARQALAGFLGIGLDAPTMEKIEDAEWGDACLGLGGPAESCAAVVTSGYAVTFMVEGESYTVRTDRDGNQARVETPGGEAPGGDALPPAVEAARVALAHELGVELAAVVLVDFEQREWSDSCLGLGGPAESCAAVVTPGYAITFMVESESYNVRTDRDGNQPRVETPGGQAPGGDALPPAVEAARVALAHELGVELAAVVLVDFEQREWSDSCLGLGGPAEICAAVVTPGWAVALDVDGQLVEVRTDFNGDQVRIAHESAGTGG